MGRGNCPIVPLMAPTITIQRRVWYRRVVLEEVCNNYDFHVAALCLWIISTNAQNPCTYNPNNHVVSNLAQCLATIRSTASDTTR